MRTVTRATKSATKIPTGLVADWKKKVTKTTGDTKAHQRASYPLGGLADDDAHAERPETIEIGNCYKTHKREVCMSNLFWA